MSSVVDVLGRRRPYLFRRCDMTPTRRTRQRILKAIERDRTDIDMPLRVIEWRTWPSVNRWGHVGEVEVEYSTRGYRAIYGFDALGNTTIYMD